MSCLINVNQDKSPKGSIQLAGARCEKLEPRDNVKKKEYFLCVGTAGGKIVQLAATSDEERNAWVAAIDAALKILNDVRDMTRPCRCHNS